MHSARRIQIGEGDQYRAVRLSALSDSPAAFCTTHAEAATRGPEIWREQAETAATGSDRAIFFAMDNGETVGLAALYRHPERAGIGELLQVWIAPEHRGNGAAQALLDGLIRWGVTEAGFTAIIAEVKANNERAIGFYLRYGFTVAEEIRANDADEIVLWFPIGPV